MDLASNHFQDDWSNNELFFLTPGDSHSSPGMLQFISMIQDIHPGIFVHSVRIDEDLDKDKQAGFVRLFLK